MIAKYQNKLFKIYLENPNINKADGILLLLDYFLKATKAVLGIKKIII